MTNGNNVLDKCLAELQTIDVSDALCVLGALLTTALCQYGPHERGEITDKFVSILYKELAELEPTKQ